MFSAAFKAIAQCFSRPFFFTLAKAFGVTIVLLGGLSWLLIWLAHFLPSMPWGWLNATLSILVTVGATLAAILLAGPVAMIVIGLFLDEIALKVDRRYYPAAGPPRHIPFSETLLTALGLAALALALNLLALPVYLFAPGLNLFAYFVINGSLIGREYYLLVAARRLPPESAKLLRRQHGLVIFSAGCLIALLLLIPGVNFLGPLFGTAFMVHLVEHLRRPFAPAPAQPVAPLAVPAAGDGAHGVRDKPPGVDNGH